jgi:hypothetical protein
VKRRENFGIVNKSTAFGSAAQRKIVESRTKALHFVQPCTEKIMNCEQKYFFLFSRAAKILESWKAVHFIQLCSENLWNCEQKSLGIATKSIAFCSAAQRNFFELWTKALYFVQPRSENFGIPIKTTQTACILFCRTAKK